jgi:carboxypeptidase D
MYDAVIGSYDYIQEQLVAWPYIEENSNMIGLNKSYMAQLKAQDESCGYAAYRDKYAVYPAAGVQPVTPAQVSDKCRINDLASNAAFGPNPCFNSYEINTQCKPPSSMLDQSNM